MKLVADSMLAKLARWMRLAGISVYSTPYVDDNKIITYVKRRRALLLTCDTALANRSKRRGFNVLLVDCNEDIEHQMAFVIRSLKLHVSDEPSMICTMCNSKLKKVKKSAVKGIVPAKAYDSHDNFYICTKCKRVYWEGTHWKRIKNRISRVKRII